MTCTDLLDALPVAVVTVGPDGRIAEVNRPMCALTGYDRDELVGAPVERLVPEALRKRHAELRARYAKAPAPRLMAPRPDIVCRRKDGSSFPAEISLGPLPGGYVACLVRDEAERRAEEDALRFQSGHDPLTGLANRLLLADRLDVALRRSRRTGTSVAVLFLDLDRFKPVNDRFGHAAGDRMLRIVARRLEGAVRPADTVARYGGDEFVVVCDDVVESEDVEDVAERIRRAVGRPAPVAAGVDAAVTASIGVALAMFDTAPASLLKAADAAAYRVKAAGGDGYELVVLLGRAPTAGSPPAVGSRAGR